MVAGSLLISLLVAGAWIAYVCWWPKVRARADLLEWQKQCLQYTPPSGTAYFEVLSEPQTRWGFGQNISSHNMELSPSPASGKPVMVSPPVGPSSFSSCVHIPACWRAFVQRSGLQLPTNEAVLFMGERRNSRGEARLIVVTICSGPSRPEVPDIPGRAHVTVIHPATWFQPPRELHSPRPIVVSLLPYTDTDAPMQLSFDCGRTDPADARHFTILFSWTGSGTINRLHGWLRDDDSVQLEPDDPLLRSLLNYPTTTPVFQP